jgi:Phosphodiester glycosidase
VPAQRDNRSRDNRGRPAPPTSHRKTKSAKKPRSPKSRRRRKLVGRSILAVFLLVTGYVGVTMYPYLVQPGTDPLEGRIAEWGRDHDLGFAVTWLENHTYQAPATGGSLTASQLAQLGGPSAKPKRSGAPAADLPSNIAALASPALPGEGVWQPETSTAAGVPIVEKAVLRPDAQHTSQLAYVEWMRQSALEFTLNPGYQQPGGSWPTPDKIVAGASTGLVATWNGGFKLTPDDDALGGFYASGRTAFPLVQGQASEVFYRDGSLRIGAWGRDEKMSPDVVGVRQNLSLLVDHGQVMVDAGAGSSAKWGITISNAYFVPRSGVGMTADGDIVYVGGADLSVLTLAQLLKAAGAVYGMELDINTDWVSFMNYAPGGDPASPTPTKAWDFLQSADRYYQSSDRDFVSVFTR